MNNAATIYSGAGYGIVNSYGWWCFTRAALEKKKASRMHVRGWWAERGKITVIGRLERASIAHPVDSLYARSRHVFAIY
jgi:hypothetical protein